METVRMIKITMITLILIICAYEDIKEKKVHQGIILGGMIASLGLTIVGNDIGYINCILGCLIGGIMMVVCKATKGAVGAGDALAVGMVGAAIGAFDALLVLFYGLFITAIVSIILLIMKRVKKNTRMPFIPFILIGFVGVVFSW